MRPRSLRLAVPALALALAASRAAAQLVPGTEEPANAAEAVDDAHGVVCTLAAAGRPVGGLNIPMVGGEGYAPLDRAPDSLARFVPAAPQQKIFEYKGAGGPLWIVYDQASRRCAIYAFADPAPVEARLLETLDRSAKLHMWKRVKDAGPGIDDLYEWKAEPGLRLLTEISKPRASGEPFVVVVRPSR
jgi:hypothetical protein